MTAFDTAWAIVKMPIVQGSVQRDYSVNKLPNFPSHIKRYTAEFDDPKTGERMNMAANYNPEESIYAWIDDPKYTDDIEGRASANFRGFPGGISERPKFEATGLETDDDYQRRGYATAIYDLVAYILDRHGADLTPSIDQTKEGKAFWNSVLSNLEDDEPKRWRIRGDLG